jgi:phosphoserine phosphatase
MQQAALEEYSSLARIAAIDVDGTLYSEHTAQLAFLRLLRSTGLLGWADLARLAVIFLSHRFALLDSAEARRRGMAVLDGLPTSQAELLADQLVAALLPRVAREARDEIAELQRSGCRVLLVSAGLSMVVGRLAAALDADGYLATELAVVAGRCRAAFTGPVVEGPTSGWPCGATPIAASVPAAGSSPTPTATRQTTCPCWHRPSAPSP